MKAPSFSLFFWLSACLTPLFLLGVNQGVAAPDTKEPNYLAAKYDPIHFKPTIEKATDEQCLACHAEVLEPSVRQKSPAGLSSENARAWYQLGATYKGEQDSFHRRHLKSEYAKHVMRMRCTTCHEGNDPREEAPGSSATDFGQQVLRKMVNPETICLRCHGKMNHEVMGLPATWAQIKGMFQNNCLLCHEHIRTNRHNVNYLNAKAIEEEGARPNGGDACHGCHGGRAWYRLIFPYARHPWKGMAQTVPDWAKDRPTQSEARFLVNEAAPGEKK